MVAKDFEIGDLVWAKMKGFPAWPGKIIEPPDDNKSPKQKKPQHYVYFFGSNNHAWILDENIVPHNDSMIQSTNKKKNAAYQSAVEAIVNQSKSAKKGNNVHKVLKEKEQNANKELSQNETPKSANNASKKNEKKVHTSTSDKDVSVQKKSAKRRQLSLIDSDTDGAESSVSCPKSQRVENAYADLLASVPPNMGYSQLASYDSPYHQSPGILSRPAYIERPPTPVLDLSDISSEFNDKGIVASSTKIGFLGLGIMGQGMVKNLLKSGHHVTVWNRTPGKMDAFLKAGASKGQTPADVILASDITFCCVSDPDAVKCLVFGNCGVLKGFDACSGSNKGYVEMTSIDPETSQAVAVEITLKGGRYLEAPVAGSKANALDGSLFILAAGDRTLFTECETCFHAIGKDCYYISSEIGTGAKMNLIHSMLHGTLYAAMAEAMALVDGCKLSQGDFLEIFQLGPLNCEAMREKGKLILQRNYLTNTPLKHIQKDLSLALTLSASADQPLPIAAAANEVYKHAKQLRYADHDVSAVYQGTRY